jgi:chloramphenicol O-acetyltransferase type A
MPSPVPPFQAIDPRQTPRARAYAFYREAERPRWGVTFAVDLTTLLDRLSLWRAELPGLTPFVAYHHAILRAANAVPALRQRLTPEGAVQWHRVDATPTVLREDESFAVARLVYAERLDDFAGPALAAVAEARQPDAPWGVRTAQSGELHMTTLPAVAFTHFTHARRGGFDDATPSLALGRFVRDGERVTMAVNIEVHHALVDGLHVGRFAEGLAALLAEPERLRERVSAAA